MGRRLRTLRSWFGGWLPGVQGHWNTEILLLINALVSIVVGIAVLVRSLSFAWGAGAAAAVFAALVLCLFSPRTAPIAATAGSLAVGTVVGFVGWVLGGSSTVLSLLLASVSGGGALAGTFWMYMRFVRDTTGAGPLAGSFSGTYVHRTDLRAPEQGAATVVVAAAESDAHDLRISGLVIGGVPVELYGVRKQGDEAADLTGAADLSRGPAGSFELWNGRATIHDGGTLIIDLGGPFGGYVFTGATTASRRR